MAADDNRLRRVVDVAEPCRRDDTFVGSFAVRLQDRTAGLAVGGQESACWRMGTGQFVEVEMEEEETHLWRLRRWSAVGVYSFAYLDQFQGSQGGQEPVPHERLDLRVMETYDSTKIGLFAP